EAEQRRLLYVGMTRARDLLVLSGGQTAKPGHDTVLSLLGETIADEGTHSPDDKIRIGTSRLTRVITPATVSVRRHQPKLLSATASRPALGPILMRHQARQAEWERCRTTLRRLTPSSLAEGMPKAFSPGSVTGHNADHGRLVGVCAHAVLERWDFTRSHAEIRPVIEQACRRYVAQDHPELMADVTADLTAVFGRFLSSKPYKTLQRATVLGREVPFAMPLGEGQMMEGVIDLIYRLDGQICIADYKTDDVAAEDVQVRADRYRSQAERYARAVEKSLGFSSFSFQLVFLRPGIAIDV